MLISFLLFLLAACGGNSKNSEISEKPETSENSQGSTSLGLLELSERDKEMANGNPNSAAEILIQKAILQEARDEKLTEEEQYNLDLAKQEVEVNFYLQKKFNEKFRDISSVTDEEAKK